jgi:hypothetical protein
LRRITIINPSAERANDVLLITEVKSALADDGVAEDFPIVVDGDHGKILLSGISAEAAKRAGNTAASAPGVVTVKKSADLAPDPPIINDNPALEGRRPGTTRRQTLFTSNSELHRFGNQLITSDLCVDPS